MVVVSERAMEEGLGRQPLMKYAQGPAAGCSIAPNWLHPFVPVTGRHGCHNRPVTCQGSSLSLGSQAYLHNLPNCAMLLNGVTVTQLCQESHACQWTRFTGRLVADYFCLQTLISLASGMVPTNCSFFNRCIYPKLYFVLVFYRTKRLTFRALPGIWKQMPWVPRLGNSVLGY